MWVLRNAASGRSPEYTGSVSSLRGLAGVDLGRRRVELSESEMTYYALMIAGDNASSFDVLFEDGQPACPSYALPLSEWAMHELVTAADFDHTRTMLAGLTLTMKRPLPTGGWLDMAARVPVVWDTGRAALVDVEVASEYFTVHFVVYVPDGGGFGGPAPPRSETSGECRPDFVLPLAHADTAVYRKVRTDATEAPDPGQTRPVQPGLITFARGLVSLVQHHHLPAERVHEMRARFVAPARLGEPLSLHGCDDGRFVVRGEKGVILDDGRLTVSATAMS